MFTQPVDMNDYVLTKKSPQKCSNLVQSLVESTLEYQIQVTDEITVTGYHFEKINNRNGRK